MKRVVKLCIPLICGNSDLREQRPKFFLNLLFYPGRVCRQDIRRDTLLWPGTGVVPGPDGEQAELCYSGQTTVMPRRYRHVLPVQN
jgi:hypothetical protein